MIPQFGIIADGYQDVDQKINLIGIHYGKRVAQLPAEVTLTVAVGFRLGSMEKFGPKQVITIHLVDPAGRELFKIEGTENSNSELSPFGTQKYRMNLFVPVKVTFPVEGRYTWNVKNNGVSWMTIPYQIYTKNPIEEPGEKGDWEKAK